MNRSAKRRTVWLTAVFFGIITTFFTFMILAMMPKYQSSSTRAELQDADLSRRTVCLDASLADFYPGRLFDSSDFSEGGCTSGDPNTKFATYRIVLSLRPGVTYGLTGQTATYAQRVFVNGELLAECGKVSDSPTDFTPRTDLYTIYFTPQSAQTEIIVQHAWFNHQHGALHKLYLGQQRVISRMERAQTLCDGLITGTLLASAIFFFGMFLFYPGNRGMLWFSLSGLCAALNYLIYESKQIMVFFPRLNWYVGHKIELLSNVYYFVFIALFAFSMLHCRPKRWFSVLTFSLLAAISIYYAAAPSVFYTRFTVPIGAGMMFYELFVVIALLVQVVRDKKLRHLDNVLVCLSPVLTLAVYVIEGVTYFSHIFYLRAYLMILMTFCNALVLTISFSRTERRLSEAQRRELEIAEENAMLEKLNSLKSDFLRNLAHEMKTPLTVMSGYAQLTERQLRKNAVNEETTDNLETIAREAGRLSDMVTQLLDVTYHGAGSTERTHFRPEELLRDAAAVCRPVLQKNGNRLRLSCESRTSLLANKESLLQVLINLAINSGKHTLDGEVIFAASDVQNAVAFSVTDNGSGIDEADLPHIFERGYGTDGGNGLGLTICRDIIESMGGHIAVEQTGTSGTTIRFTVPIEKEAHV